MRYVLTGCGFGLVFLLGWLALASTQPTPAPAAAPEETLVEEGRLSQKVEPVDLSGPFTFAGEEIPVDNFDVRERLDQELLRNAYFHRNTLVMLKRRTRFFPTIERILAEEGLPEDLKYLAVAESGLANVKSPAGAQGVWQFMAPTGRAYGLEINKEVDERYHLEKATRAACAYIKDYYKQYDDWRWVAAAYNMGGPNVNKWRERQRAETVFDLDINSETMAYLFRIVALKTIMEDPAAFGYDISAEDHYPPLEGWRPLTVSKSIANLGDFAKEHGTNYRTLKLYNPWLIAGSLPISRGNSYAILVPQ
ncbi:MAG: lytic transglycosylase domain-containing protein [Bacteroidota bacterium]